MKYFIKHFNTTLIISAAAATILGICYFMAEYNHEKLSILIATSDSTNFSDQKPTSNSSILPHNLNSNRIKDVHKILGGKYFYILSDRDILNENCKDGNLSCKMTFMLGNKLLNDKSLDDPINGGTYASIGETDFHIANTDTYIISSYLGNVDDSKIPHEQIVQIDKNAYVRVSAPFDAKENQLSNSNKYKNIYTLNKNTLTILGNNNSYYKFTNGKLSKVDNKVKRTSMHQLA